MDGIYESIAEIGANGKYGGGIMEETKGSKINMEVDTSALDQEIANYEKQLRQLYHNKDTILSDIDSLDYEDKHYQRRKTDLENRLYKIYDKIDEAEALLISAKLRNALCWQTRLPATISTRHSFSLISCMPK